MQQSLALVEIDTSSASTPFPPGMEVGAHRWPQPSGRPWKGVALSVNDPFAWAGSLAFGPGVPAQEDVDRHIAWCRERGLLRAHQPVRWEFGRVYWEALGDGDYDLRPYAEDVARWEAHQHVTVQRAAA